MLNPPSAGADGNPSHTSAVLIKTLKVKSRKPAQLGCDYVFPIVLAALVVLYAKLSPAAITIVYPETSSTANLTTYPITFGSADLKKWVDPAYFRDPANCVNSSFFCKGIIGALSNATKKSLILVSVDPDSYRLATTLRDKMFVKTCNASCLVDPEKLIGFPGACQDPSVAKTCELICKSPTFCPTIEVSQSESDVEERFRVNSEGIWAAAVLSNVTRNGADAVSALELTLRMSQDDIPSTSAALEPFTSIANLQRTISKWVPWDTSSYYQSGYVFVQDSLHRQIASLRADVADENPLKVQAFPHRSFERRGDYSVFGQYFMLMLMPFAANTAKEMLIEKEKKIRDAMIIMGLVSRTFWAGWTISALLLSSPIIVLQIGLELWCFGNAPRGLAVLSTLLFWTSTIFLVFTMYAVCRKANFGTIGIVLHM